MGKLEGLIYRGYTIPDVYKGFTIGMCTKRSKKFTSNFVEGLGNHTLEVFSKKYLNVGQGLDFLKFSEGNRGQNEENRRKIVETSRKTNEKSIR